MGLLQKALAHGSRVGWTPAQRIDTAHSLHQSFGSLATARLGLLGFLKAILCKKTQQKQTTQR